MADHSMWSKLTTGSNLQLLRCLKPGCGSANNWFPSTFQNIVAKVPGLMCTTHMVKLLVENREVLPGQQFQVAVFITLQPARRLNFEWIFFNLRLFLRSCTIAFPLHKVINSLLDQNSWLIFQDQGTSIHLTTHKFCPRSTDINKHLA